MKRLIVGLLLASTALPQVSWAGTVYQTTAAGACLPEHGTGWKYAGSAIEKLPTYGAVHQQLRLVCAIPLGPNTVELSQLASVLLFVVDRSSNATVRGSLCLADLATGVERCGEEVGSSGSTEHQSLMLLPPANFVAWVPAVYLKIEVPFLYPNESGSRVKGFVVYSQD
jgi:hypothetical protein